VPFLFLIYPGILADGSWLQIGDALLSGVLFTGAFALLFGGARPTGIRILDIALPLAVVVLAILPYRIGLLGAVAFAAVLVAQWMKGRTRPAAELRRPAGSPTRP
jgi:hypothetical protein